MAGVSTSQAEALLGWSDDGMESDGPLFPAAKGQAAVDDLGLEEDHDGDEDLEAETWRRFAKAGGDIPEPLMAVQALRRVLPVISLTVALQAVLDIHGKDKVLPEATRLCSMGSVAEEGAPFDEAQIFGVLNPEDKSAFFSRVSELVCTRLILLKPFTQHSVALRGELVDAVQRSFPKITNRDFIHHKLADSSRQRNFRVRARVKVATSQMRRRGEHDEDLRHGSVTEEEWNRVVRWGVLELERGGGRWPRPQQATATEARLKKHDGGGSNPFGRGGATEFRKSFYLRWGEMPTKAEEEWCRVNDIEDIHIFRVAQRSRGAVAGGGGRAGMQPEDTVIVPATVEAPTTGRTETEGATKGASGSSQLAKTKAKQALKRKLVNGQSQRDEANDGVGEMSK